MADNTQVICNRADLVEIADAVREGNGITRELSLKEIAGLVTSGKANLTDIPGVSYGVISVDGSQLLDMPSYLVLPSIAGFDQVILIEPTSELFYTPCLFTSKDGASLLTVYDNPMGVYCNETPYDKKSGTIEWSLDLASTRSNYLIFYVVWNWIQASVDSIMVNAIEGMTWRYYIENNVFDEGGHNFSISENGEVLRLGSTITAIDTPGFVMADDLIRATNYGISS